MTTVASCTIRDADEDEAVFYDLVVRQAGLRVPLGRSNARVRVATHFGQVVGFASTTSDDDGTRLDYVYVHSHARRCGVGRALVDDARPSGTTGVPVRVEAHPAAEAFFHRVGACREGTLRPDDETPFSRALFSVS